MYFLHFKKSFENTLGIIEGEVTKGFIPLI